MYKLVEGAIYHHALDARWRWIFVIYTADSDYTADEVLYHVQNKVYLSGWLISTFSCNTSKPGLLMHKKSRELFKCKRAIHQLVLGSAIETSHWNAGLVNSSGAVIGCWGQAKGSPESPYLTFTTLRLRREATIGCVNSKKSDYYNSLFVVLSFTGKRAETSMVY